MYEDVVSIQPEEYLQCERAAEFRSEYWFGRLLVMSGGTENHELIASNLRLHTQNALQGSGCRVFGSSMKVGITTRRGFAYPDLTIVCGERLFFDAVRDVLMNPVVIFEVLSESTRSFDLAAKFREYQRLESLRHYVAVEQDVRAVMHYDRASDGRWAYEALTAPEDVLRLTAAAGLQLPLAGIYDGVSLRTVDT